MSDRWVTLLGGLAVLAMVVGLLLQSRLPEGERVSLPQSQDTGPAGYAGWHRWLAQSGVPVHSLQHRYSHLPKLDLPATGNLLVVTLPQVYPMRFGERQALQRWLADGNTLLLQWRTDDVPHWNLGGDDQVVALLAALGIEVAWPEPEAPQEAPEQSASDNTETDGPSDPGEALILQAYTDHPLVEGVNSVSLDRDTAVSAMWLLQPVEADGLLVPLLYNPETMQNSFWAGHALGQRVWVSRHAQMFSNSAIGQADNARLAINLVASSLRGAGAVIFDDMHQGSSALYDPDAFFSDPRLHATLGLILLAWLIYLLGYGNRFVPPRRAAAQISNADFLHTTAGFYARCLPPADLARRLLGHFRHSVNQRYPQGDPQAPWQTLAGKPRVDRAKLAELQALEKQLASGRKVDLVRLHNLTLEIGNAIT